MSCPRVVHVNDHVEGAVYIGRANGRHGLDASPLANPYKIGVDGDRAEVIALYERWLLDHPALVAQAKWELGGRDLACWCAPLACHGDTLLRVANDVAPECPNGSAANFRHCKCWYHGQPCCGCGDSTVKRVEIGGAR